jgi:hypothetical protein
MHLSKITSTKRLLVILLLVLLVIRVALDVLEASFLIGEPDRILVLVDDLIVKLDKLGVPPKLVSSLARSKLNVAPPTLEAMTALATAGLFNSPSCIYPKIYPASVFACCAHCLRSSNMPGPNSQRYASLSRTLLTLSTSDLEPTRTCSSSPALHDCLASSSSS